MENTLLVDETYYFVRANIPGDEPFLAGLIEGAGDIDWLTFKMQGEPITPANIDIVQDKVDEAEAFADRSEAALANIIATYPALPAMTTYNIAGLLAVTGMHNGQVATVSGYDTAHDGGGGIFIYDASQSGVNNGGTIFNGWVRQYSGSVSVKWFGAYGDGTTNDHDSIAMALAVVDISGETLYVPTGKYLSDNTQNSYTWSNSMTIVGDGMKSSIFLYNDDASTARRDFFSILSCHDVYIRDIGFESTWGAMGDYTQRSQMLSIQESTGVVSIYKCSFRDSRFMAVVISKAAKVFVMNCLLNQIRRDGIRVTNTSEAFIKNNSLHRVMDDSIAVHVSDNDANANSINRSCVITNNTIVESNGIRCLGLNNGVVSNNLIKRPATMGIHFGSSNSFAEGNNNNFGVTIRGNTISDVFSNSTFLPTGGTAKSVIVVTGTIGLNESGRYAYGIDGNGGIVNPYKFMYSVKTNVSGVSNPNMGLNISDNVYIRTFQSGMSYLEATGGKRFTSEGLVDVQLTEDDLHPDGIFVSGGFRNSIISNNSLDSITSGVLVNSADTPDIIGIGNSKVSGNSISNFTKYGIRVASKGNGSISDNTLDGDPLMTHASRSSTVKGGWDDAQFPVGIGGAVGFIGSVQRNSIFNVSRSSEGLSEVEQGKNIVYADLVDGNNGTYDASNRGVGSVINWKLFGTIVFVTAHPYSIKYGQIRNTMLEVSPNMPTTGQYIAGHYVRKLVNSGTVTNRLLGWVRATDGSDHVLNVDWVEDYSYSTP